VGPIAYRVSVAATIPVILCVDVEPDGRQLERHDPAPWSGFEAVHRWLEEIRPRLAVATGAPARFSWYFRMDPQVAEVYGSPGWGATQHRRQVDTMRAQGDEPGVHPHAYRWDEAHASWVVDHGSPPWVERCVRVALAAFRETLGAPCRVFRFGDHWMSDATVALLEAEGVHIDLTLEPGMAGQPGLVADERPTGAIPDLTAVPRRPYHPSRGDFRASDPGRTDGLWMVPVTTGRLPLTLRGARAAYRWITGAPGVTLDTLALNLGLAPMLFRAVAAPALRVLELPCLVPVLHSRTGTTRRAMANLAANVDYLLAHPLRRRFRFSTPTDAVRQLSPA
jgi:hypothetical protein